MAHIGHFVIGFDDRSYSLEVNPVGDETEDRYHVALIDDRYATLLTFVGTGDQLHGLFLGLHNVLVDAGRAETHRSTLVIPGQGTGDERGGSSGG